MISLKTHGVADYLAGLLLVAAPFLLGFENLDAAGNTFFLCGALLIGYSLISRYPLSLVKALPLGAHITFDAAIGTILILAPTVLGYRSLLAGEQEAAHYLIGFALIGLAAVTREKTDAEKRAKKPEPASRSHFRSPSGAARS